jgi:hypothetical protein
MQTWNEKNMTRLWCKIVPNINAEQIEGNEGSYSYLYPFGDLNQISFQGGLYVCSRYKSFLGTFLIKNQLWVNLKLN